MLVISSRTSKSLTLVQDGKQEFSIQVSNHTNSCRHEQAQPSNLQQRRHANIAPVKTAIPAHAVEILSGAKPGFTPSSMTPGMPTTATTPAFRPVSELVEDSDPDTSPHNSTYHTPSPPPTTRALVTYLQQVYGAIGSGPAPTHNTLPPLDIGTFTAEGGTTRAFAIDGFRLQKCDDFITIGTSLAVGTCCRFLISY